jgi:hypothetical protein
VFKWANQILQFLELDVPVSVFRIDVRATRPSRTIDLAGQVCWCFLYEDCYVGTLLITFYAGISFCIWLQMCMLVYYLNLVPTYFSFSYKVSFGITSVWLLEESTKTYNLVWPILDVAEKSSAEYKSCTTANMRKSEVPTSITRSSGFIKHKEDSVQTATTEPKAWSSLLVSYIREIWR